MYRQQTVEATPDEIAEAETQIAQENRAAAAAKAEAEQSAASEEK